MIVSFRRQQMKARPGRSALLLSLCVYWLIPQAGLVAQTKGEPQPAPSDYATGPTWFPTVFRPYQEQPILPLVLENSPRLESLLHDGTLELTLADAVALALENNLDIAVQRYLPNFAQIDVLRAKSGQAARGFSGALIPGGLSAGALGAGVTGTSAGSGVGSAGGITGGGGAVQVGATGNFDPSFNFNFSWDRVTSPLNTIQVSGVPTVTGYTTAYSGSYAQLFHEGGSYSLALSGQRQSSTQQYLTFNPAVVTRFALGFNQPLLNGFGLLPNERFIRVARNNTKVSEEVFRQQVVTTVVLVENTYWDLAALQENVRVAEQSLAVSQRLYKDNQMRLEIGTMSPLDVTTAEAQVAASIRDLTVAQTNVQMQEATLKNILTKKVSPELDAARIVIRDRMPEPKDSDLPDLQTALAAALENRPDLKQAERNLLNQDVSIKYTENNLLPSASVFGFYAGSGLQGNGANLATGAVDALSQTFQGSFPEYAGGLTVSIPLRNRVAQADNVRSQLEGKQLRVSLQRSRNQVALEVRKAIIGMIQGKAQVEAAHQATRLARETWEGEQQKLEAGAATSYQVILRERDLIAAEQAEVTAVAGYAKAIVEMDRSMGATLDRNGIEFGDALSGTVSKMPITPFTLRGSNKEAK
jgi:outer membrane protein